MKKLFYALRGIKTLFYVYVPIMLITLVVVVMTLVKHLNIGFFIRDMATVANVNPFYGILSIIGIIFWFASAIICLFGVTLIRHDSSHDSTQLLINVGLISLIMGTDDLFLFHEVVFPHYLHLFGEKVIMLMYGVVILGTLYRFRSIIKTTNWGILLLAGGLLALSILIDRLPEAWAGDWSYFYEDAPKLFGIVTWFVYWANFTRETIMHVLGHSQADVSVALKSNDDYASRSASQQTI